MAKYWVEFQYDIGELPDDVELSGFSSLCYEITLLSPYSIIKLKQFIADTISRKALEVKGIDVAELRKQYYGETKNSPFALNYNNERNWSIKAEEINLTLVLKLEGE